MNKLKMTITAACAALLVACGGSVENKPEEVTKAFVKRMSEKDFSGAAELCTKGTAKDVEKLGEMAALMPASSLEKEEVKCTTEGDKATCTFCCAAGKGEDTYELEKEDGNWRVKFSKGLDKAGEKLEEGMEKMEETIDAVDSTMTDTTAGE